MTGRSTRTFAATWVAVALAACDGGEGGTGDRRNTFEVRDLIVGHVLPHVLRSRDFETGPLPMGDDGHPIHQVSVEGDVVVIDGAEVVGALEAVNGIAYVVDGILGLDRIELEAVS